MVQSASPRASSTPSQKRRSLPRDELGLTTLEWLLITAAVAGMAALAVVLVSNAAEDTGAQLTDPDPRLTAAKLQAFEVARYATTASEDDFETWDDWERHFRRQCSLIEILYGDTVFDAAAAGFAAADDADAPTASKAQTVCAVQYSQSASGWSDAGRLRRRPPLHQARHPQAQRQPRAPPPHRRRGVLCRLLEGVTIDATDMF